MFIRTGAAHDVSERLDSLILFWNIVQLYFGFFSKSFYFSPVYCLPLLLTVFPHSHTHVPTISSALPSSPFAHHTSLHVIFIPLHPSSALLSPVISVNPTHLNPKAWYRSCSAVAPTAEVDVGRRWTPWRIPLFVKADCESTCLRSDWTIPVRLSHYRPAAEDERAAGSGMREHSWPRCSLLQDGGELNRNWCLRVHRHTWEELIGRRWFWWGNYSGNLWLEVKSSYLPISHTILEKVSFIFVNFRQTDR